MIVFDRIRNILRLGFISESADLGKQFKGTEVALLDS